jgi:hypothetical protein
LRPIEPCHNLCSFHQDKRKTPKRGGSPPVLVLFHSHAPAAKLDALHLQPQTLLVGGVAPEPDIAARIHQGNDPPELRSSCAARR